jgi:hypothetical protein
MSESSVGSSSEINSPVSFTPTENIGDATEGLDEIMDILDLGEPSGDFMICRNSTSDMSTDTWKIGSELHEVTKQSSQVSAAKSTTSTKCLQS